MKKLHLILISAAVLFSLGASAQSFRSGYFLDNYVYGYRINPAQVNDKSFLGVAIGNIDINANANVGMGSFLFPSGNNLVTGLNNAVSKEQFLGGLMENNALGLDAGINILTVGIANGERMHTIELNARVLNTENIPLDLMKFAKSGAVGTYNIGGLYADLSVVADLAYGYSMKIGESISVGGRVHLLLGLANLNLSGNNSSITLSDQSISLNPDLGVNLSGLPNIGTGDDGNLDLGKIGFGGSAVGGFGASLDLGAQYKSPFGLEAMISVTDLGAVSWKNNTAVSLSSSYTYSGGKLAFEGGTVKTDLEDAVEEMKGLLDLKAGTGKSGLSMMPFNIAAGARYSMPFYDKLSVGALATYHSAKYTSWFDARVGATITPARILSASANIGYGSFGPVWGAGLNTHLGPVNLVLGADGFMGKTGKVKGVPVPLGKFMGDLHVGLSLTF